MHQSTDKKIKISLYLIFLIILSTTTRELPEKQKKYSLKIDTIEVIGLSNDKNLEIQNDLSSIFYQNIFTVGKKEINKIINKHNIVEEYNIKKIYPTTLNIVIKPTKFIAKATNINQFIVGSNGKLIPGESVNKILPSIYGEFNSKEFLRFKKDVDQSKFNFSEFMTIYFFPSTRWDILTIDGVLIKLPQNNIIKPLNLAYKIIASKQFKGKNIIDLRVKNHLIIK